jgi:tetratricopeptide (TPR) repeat protein
VIRSSRSAVVRPRAGAALSLAALLCALPSCKDRSPDVVIAAPATPPPGDRPAPDAPARPADPTSRPPRTGPRPEGAPSSSELLAQVDALKGQLAGARKTVEIMAAIGDLYYEHQRHADAVEWYDQAVLAAQPTWKAYLALPAAALSATAPAAPERCTRGPGRGHAELAAEGRARAARGDRAGAAACFRAALDPAVLAEVHRANVWFLGGDARRAISAQEAVLARAPGHPEASYFLALYLADTAGDDVAQLRRARALLDDLVRRGVAPHRSDELRAAIEEIDRRTSAAGVGAR